MTFPVTFFVVLISIAPGCFPSGEDAPLVVATPWPPGVRKDLESSFRKQIGDSLKIAWVDVAPGDSMARVIDRRGGVDVLLGGPATSHESLAIAGHSIAIDLASGVSWEVARRPAPDAIRRPAVEELQGFGSFSDPRDDPDSLALARAVIDQEGWAQGYEALVRQASRSRLRSGRPRMHPPGGEIPTAKSAHPVEGVSLARGGRQPRRARQFLKFLEGEGLAGVASDRERDEARADDVLADLLGAAMVDSHEELRGAEAALVRHGHPREAEAAIGQRPPWPPASVAKLLASPNGGSMVETLLEQVAPDPDARAWLLESWSRPKRPIDGPLIADLARAAEGRLVREPRFRAWLRSEWTAWTRQSYRRVARVAGGYVPS